MYIPATLRSLARNSLLTCYYLYSSVRHWVSPLSLFALNAQHLHLETGKYSKHKMNAQVPMPQQLPSIILPHDVSQEEHHSQIQKHVQLPAILKPDWGHNSYGVRKVTSKEELHTALLEVQQFKTHYMCQQFCDHPLEYELYYLREKPKGKMRVFTITRVESPYITGNGKSTVGQLLQEQHPTLVGKSTISSEKVLRKGEQRDVTFRRGIPFGARYTDETNQFSAQEQKRILKHLEHMGDFMITRVCVKVQKPEDLVKGKFKIIESNILLPWAVHLLDEKYTASQRLWLMKENIDDIFRTIKATHAVRKSPSFQSLFQFFIKKPLPCGENKAIAMSDKLWKLLKTPYDYVREYIFLADCSNYNTDEVRRRSRTKERARNMFAQHGIPHAKGEIFVNPLKALQFVQKHGYPVVVKPNFGGFSRGSFFPIENKKQLLHALVSVKRYWPKTVIEQYLKGANYRILVIGGKVAVVCRRYPAFVKGDGKSTISQLMEKENAIRKKMKLYPIMYPLQKSPQAEEMLRKQGLTFASIPKRNQVIEMGNKVALATGGVLEHVPLSKVTKKNQQLFKKVLRIFDAKIFGIDVIMEKGAHVDYDKQKCIFLEVNSRPYIKMHAYPRYGKRANLEPFLQKIQSEAP